MGNYSDQIEAAYLISKRQGNMMRDPGKERSSHEDRRNRYVEDRLQPGPETYGSKDTKGQRVHSYRPTDSGYMERLASNYRGKGPRNYKRSDERIKELVCDLLCDNPELDASNIEVSVENSEVILTGEVDERYGKRLAEDLAESVTGVSNVVNRIRVNQRQMV